MHLTLYSLESSSFQVNTAEQQDHQENCIDPGENKLSCFFSQSL